MFRLRSPQVVSLRLVWLAALISVPAIGLSLRDSSVTRSPAASQTDTVVVYGPLNFSTPNGSPQTFVETFPINVPSESYQAIRIVNGPGSLVNADSLSVELNGTELITGTFNESTTDLEIPVTFLTSDTLEVVVAGDPDAGVEISGVAVMDHELTIYGPTQFTTLSGPPQWVTEQFTLPPTCGEPYTLRIDNGNPGGTDRIEAGRVHLNSIEVAGYADLDEAVAEFEDDVALIAENELSVRLDSAIGSFITIEVTCIGGAEPVVQIETPAAGAATATSQVSVSGTVNTVNTVTVEVNEQAATVGAGNTFDATVSLSGGDGAYAIEVEATDAQSRTGSAIREIILDTSAPIVTVTAPAQGLVTGQTTVNVIGWVADLTSFTVSANGVPMTVDTLAGFHGIVPLTEGENTITVTATDAAGNNANVVRTVTHDPEAPWQTIVGPEGTVPGILKVCVAGAPGTYTFAGDEESPGYNGSFVVASPFTISAGSCTDVVWQADSGASSEPITITQTDAPPETSLDSIIVAAEQWQIEGGVDGILVPSGTVELWVHWEHGANITFINSGDEEALPPDPAMVAPPIDSTVATTLFAATEFLYAGPDSIQRGVAQGTIDPVRVSVIRGRVLNRNDDPLPGVTIVVKDHPEFGSTRSRADGRFDLAVNGGGVLTLDYQRDGFLPAQRQVRTPWQDYTMVDDVVMVLLDAAVTSIDFSDPVEVARGTVVSDADGTRQATLLFFGGTTAEMAFADDSTQPLATLDVRLTEYTVGLNGPQAMPAQLPPSSGYTYAVELSADQALASGATEVRFSQPQALYIENFLEFPIGLPVPVGIYDRQRGVWVPQDNGRIVAVLDTTGGIAALDIDGDSVANDSTELAALGITLAEREALASIYAAGEQLWRMPISHFSPIDANYPGGGGGDSDDEQGGGGAGTKADPVNDPCVQSGSRIECQNQILGERIAITGTPFSLNYRSDRMPAFGAANTVEVPVTGNGPSNLLTRIEVTVSIAGRETTEVFQPAPFQEFVLKWDGRDAYGRILTGQQRALVTWRRVFRRLYFVPEDLARAFGYYCPGVPSETGMPACVIDADTSMGRERSVYQFQQVLVGTAPWNGLGQGVGGWSIDAHHAYDPIGRSLYLGSGERRLARDVRTSQVVAGSGEEGYSGDGAPATAAEFFNVDQLAVGPDGSVYIIDPDVHVVRRAGPDGLITTVAGTGTQGFSGDSGPATAAQLDTPQDIAIGSDGSLYIADAGNARVRRVDSAGVITTVAGNGTVGDGGDGGPATAAELSFPAAVTVAPDGSLYIGDGEFPARVRKVSTDGVIATIMGTGENFDLCAGDSIPAAQVCIGDPIQDLVWGPDDRLYVLEETRLRRVNTDGLTRVVAGDPFLNCTTEAGDGGPSVAAGICATSVAVDPDGRIYLADNQERVRVVEPSGIIGTFGTGPCADGGGIILLMQFSSARPGIPDDMVQSTDGCLEAVALAPDGSLLIADPEALQVRRLAPVLPGYSAATLAIASQDGSEVYLFDAVGRHLETRDALTGSIQFAFGYDGEGRLATVTDADSNITTIQRDGSGDPTAIVGPFGQTTTVAVDTNGFLASITNPAGEVTSMEYQAGGLLASFTDGNSNASVFTYDPDGLLIRDENAAGGFIALDQEGPRDSTETALATALGRQTVYGVRRREAGAEGRVATSPAGLVTTTEREEDAEGKTTITTTSPDGTVTTVVQARDPRFGTSDVLDSLEVVTPAGRVTSVAASRTVELSDPANPLTLLSQVDSLVINERPFVNTFDAVSRTFAATTPEGRTSSGIVDSLGRVIAEVVPGVDTVRYAYDAQGRLTETTQGTRQWRYTYDANGRLDSVIDPLSRATTFSYDGADRVVSQALPGGRTLGYAYDSVGNLTSVTPPGRPAHTFTYTPVDLTASYNPPVVAEGATPTGYEYNLDRQLTRILRPDGDTVQFAYNAAGRPLRVVHQQDSLGYAYSPTTGNLTSVTAGAEGMSFAYDGSLLTGVTWTGPLAGSVTAGYDDDFRLQDLSVNGSLLAFFDYDGDGLLTEAGDIEIVRDPLNGRIDSTALGLVTTAETYDSFGLWSTRTAAVNGSEIYRAEYTRDALGRITGLLEVVEGDTTVLAYDYDDAGRLVEVETNGVVTATYVYDDNGNRLSVTRPSGVESGTYDDQDRLLTYAGATYGYSAAGELRFKAEGTDTTFYRYDAFGNLLEVNLPNGTDIEYVVDGFNRRVGKRLNGDLVQGLLYQNQLNPIAELDSAGNVVSRFVYGTRTNVPDYVVKNDTTYRVVADHLGSVRVVANTITGSVVQRMTYDEFGLALTNSDPGFQPFGFAGGLTERETPLVRFGARDYDPTVGRWTSAEPLGFAGGTLNLWTYVSGDPVNWSDATGLSGLLTALDNCVAGAASYFGGLADYGIHWLRRLGFFGACEQQDAFLEDELIERALRLLANQPDLRRLLRKEAAQAIGRNKARFVCRIAAGGGVTLLFGAVGGPWGTAAGAGLGVAAAFGSAHALVENTVDGIGAEDLLRAALLGS